MYSSYSYTLLCMFTVQWTTSIEALKCTLQFVDTPEAKLFIDEYVFKVINLMTQQRYRCTSIHLCINPYLVLIVACTCLL